MLVVTTYDNPMPSATLGPIITSCLSLHDVYHIPNLTLRLVYVSQLCEFEYLGGVCFFT